MGLPGRLVPVWSVLSLPLALKDPLPNILRAVGGIEGKAWRRYALICGLDGPLVQSAAATVSGERCKLETGGPRTAGRLTSKRGSVAMLAQLKKANTHAGVKSE